MNTLLYYGELGTLCNFKIVIFTIIRPIGWDCRIHQLLLCRWVRPYLYECPRYDTKQSYSEAPVMLEL